MNTFFIINGDEMHPHVISKSISLAITDQSISLLREMADGERSVINLMSEEIWGLTNYIFVVNGTKYSVCTSRYEVTNDGNKLYEKLTFILEGE